LVDLNVDVKMKLRWN